jgi:hypothetical protein
MFPKSPATPIDQRGFYAHCSGSILESEQRARPARDPEDPNLDSASSIPDLREMSREKILGFHLPFLMMNRILPYSRL